MFLTGVKEAETQDYGWQANIAGNTIMILSYWWRIMQNPAVHLKGEEPELLDQIMAYIDEHYTEKVDLEQISKQFFVSKSTVSHLFQKRLGIGIHKYLTQRRLIAAKELLYHQHTLSSIPELVGFSDYSVFFRSFKQEYGLSPQQFKQLLESTSGDRSNYN